jgi:hypothetical protein
LSNAQALELFLAHKPSYMSHVFLAHLSKENNSPELAHALFQQHAGNTEVIVATRFNETDVFNIDGSQKVQGPAMQAPRQAVQVSLF